MLVGCRYVKNIAEDNFVRPPHIIQSMNATVTNTNGFHHYTSFSHSNGNLGWSVIFSEVTESRSDMTIRASILTPGQ